MDFIIGGLAGAGATVITNPMDVVKTRLQLQGELRARNEHTPRYRGIFHALYIIARADGALALQKGLAPAMLLGFTMNSVRLGLYHVAEVQGLTKNKLGDISIHKSVFWAATSGYLSGLAANPMSVVKTRIQAASHPSIAVGRQHRYKGMIDAIITIYKTEGVRGFFAGINATCTRLAIGSGAQLTTFSKAKELLLAHEICKQSQIGLAFLASSLSGAVVALVICPFDVTTVRLYNQVYVEGKTAGEITTLEAFDLSPRRWQRIRGPLCAIVSGYDDRLTSGPATGGKLLYKGVFDCLTKIYKTEGLHGMYKGLGPLYLRIAPHTTLSLVIWDVLNNILSSKDKIS